MVDRPGAEVRDHRDVVAPVDPVEPDHAASTDVGTDERHEGVRRVSHEGDIHHAANADPRRAGRQAGRERRGRTGAGSTRAMVPETGSATYSAPSGPTVLPDPPSSPATRSRGPWPCPDRGRRGCSWPRGRRQVRRHQHCCRASSACAELVRVRLREVMSVLRGFGMTAAMTATECAAATPWHSRGSDPLGSGLDPACIRPGTCPRDRRCSALVAAPRSRLSPTVRDRHAHA